MSKYLHSVVICEQSIQGLTNLGSDRMKWMFGTYWAMKARWQVAGLRPTKGHASLLSPSLGDFLYGIKKEVEGHPYPLHAHSLFCIACVYDQDVQPLGSWAERIKQSWSHVHIYLSGARSMFVSIPSRVWVLVFVGEYCFPSSPQPTSILGQHVSPFDENGSALLWAKMWTWLTICLARLGHRPNLGLTQSADIIHNMYSWVHYTIGSICKN